MKVGVEFTDALKSMKVGVEFTDALKSTKLGVDALKNEV